MELDFSIVIDSLPLLLQGLLMTLKLTTLAVLFGSLIGSIVGVAKVVPNKLIRTVASIYVDFIRGTPLLVQIFILYYGVQALIGHSVDAYTAGLIALSINSGAYIAEIVRAGIQSIDKGQTEAARSLGLTYMQSMMRIIFPQALRRIIPPLGNEYIAMLKDSSLVSVIAIEELLRVGQLLVTRTFRAFEVYIVVALLYLCLTLLISQIVKFAERRLKVVD